MVASEVQEVGRLETAREEPPYWSCGLVLARALSKRKPAEVVCGRPALGRREWRLQRGSWAVAVFLVEINSRWRAHVASERQRKLLTFPWAEGCLLPRSGRQLRGRPLSFHRALAPHAPAALPDTSSVVSRTQRGPSSGRTGGSGGT